jgi:hypothetical protein
MFTMPSRSNKQRQFVYAAKRHLLCDREYIKAMNQEYLKCSEEEQIRLFSMQNNAHKDKLLDAVIHGLVDNLRDESKPVSPTDRILLMATILPLIGPETPDNSPSRQGAEVAREVPSAASSVLEADAVEFNDRAVFDETVNLATSILPKPVKKIAQTFRPLVEAMNNMEVTHAGKRPASRALSRPSAAKKPVKPKPRKQFEEGILSLRNASPSVNHVPAVITKLSYSELEYDRLYKDECRATSVAFPTEDAAMRMQLWQMHGHACTICSWICRFMFSNIRANERLPADDRKSVIALHAWGMLDGNLDYCNVYEGMHSFDPPVFKDDRLDVMAFEEYVALNKPRH